MSDFWIMAKKEMKNLIRDKKLLFGLIIVPLVLYPAMGKLMHVGLEKAQGETHVAIANFDDGQYGMVLVKTLQNAPNVTVTLINASSVERALEFAAKRDQNVLVVIPHNFSESIINDKPATVKLYGIFRSVSTGMKESVSEGRINAVISVLSEQIARIKIQKLGAGSPDAVLHPVRAESMSYLKNRIVPVSPSIVSGVLASQSITLPIIIFLMVTITAQMAAGAVAAEKENKTLETLLTLPVKRTTIVASKITGTALMGLIAALAYMVGMRSYMESLGVQSGISLSELGLQIAPGGMVLFALIIFLTIIFSLSLAMILAIFAQDVQSANTVVSSVILPLAFPAFILMYTGIGELPAAARYALLADPFTHPIVAYQYMLSGNYTGMLTSIAYLAVLAALTLYTTARIFSTEKVLTAKIGRGRKS